MKFCIACLSIVGCLLGSWVTSRAQNSPYSDSPFWQETHEAHPTTDEVRSVVATPDGKLWIATPRGVFRKSASQSAWEAVIGDGPAYTVFADTPSTLWLGTWNGAYRYSNHKLERLSGTDGPISVFCASPEGTYAIGPAGMWRFDGRSFVKKEVQIPRSVRAASCDAKGDVWLATDVGLYYINKVGSI